MSREDWIKIAKGAAIAVGGALVIFASTVLIPAMESSGSATLLALSAVASIVINVIRKYMALPQDE